ncbi:MAG: heavy metal-responsive transcriptional regulator [Actinobacteria bacterium]|nr:heavy metal-responsive transcriptional regulator [Actinomycetota bacterium]
MFIGELAGRTGVSPKTVRYYEDIGLLPPPARTAGGYRDYDEVAVDRLAFVKSAQAAGLTLAEIRTVIGIRDQGTAPCSHVAGLLAQKERAVAEQVDTLQALLAELRRLRRRAAGLDPAACDPRRVCEVLAPRP